MGDLAERMKQYGRTIDEERASRNRLSVAVQTLIERRKAEEAEPLFTPAGLMSELRLTRSEACTALEELEAAGELVKAHGAPAMVFKPAPPPQKVGRGGYQLQLSPREHGALLRGLDRALAPLAPKSEAEVTGDVTLLREIRRRLKGGPL